MKEYFLSIFFIWGLENPYLKNQFGLTLSKLIVVKLISSLPKLLWYRVYLNLGIVYK